MLVYVIGIINYFKKKLDLFGLFYIKNEMIIFKIRYISNSFCSIFFFVEVDKGKFL